MNNGFVGSRDRRIFHSRNAELSELKAPSVEGGQAEGITIRFQ